jgi:hypothetical protein
MLQTDGALHRRGADFHPTLRLLGGTTFHPCRLWFDDQDTRWSKTMRSQLAAAAHVDGRGVVRAWQFKRERSI